MAKKIKAVMISWVGDIKKLPAWFKDREEAELTWDQIKELYDLGNNIMVKHWKFTDNSIGMFLAVDNKSFTQR